MQGIEVGSVVKLEDGRIGIVDYVWQAQGEVQSAYVVGIEKEYAAWATPAQVAYIYGQAAKAACTATFTA